MRGGNQLRRQLQGQNQPLHQAELVFQKLVLLLVAFGITLPACSRQVGSQSDSKTAQSLPPTVAKVEGHSISTKLYTMYLKNGREAMELDENTEEGRRKLDQLREGIVSELVDRTLIAQESKRRGLHIAAEKLKEAEQRAIAELGGPQRYESYLAEHGLNRDEYREVITQQLYGDLMRTELTRDLTVSEAEIKSYYDAHRQNSNFQLPELVTAAHILIAGRPNVIEKQIQQEKGLTGEALTAAVRDEMRWRRQVAEELRQKAIKGADFSALARQWSEDPGTRERGGDLGSFPRNSHSAAFDEAAFALKPGRISPVVQTEYGFHVIKVSNRQAARTQTLNEATPEIRKRLLAEREAKRLSEWLKETRRKASIRISEPFRFGALKNEFPAL